MNVTWPVFKSFVDSKLLSIQWIDVENTYFLKAIDGAFSMECALSKSNLNDYLADFETNYKANGNQSYSDIDGIPFTRLKASKKGWSFWAIPIEFTTSLLGASAYLKDVDGNDIPGLTCKIYNNSEEITVPGLANINLLGCTKTVIDFEPAFDYELIGGSLRINSNTSEDVRLWIVGAPDIPAQYGGSKEFASGINLKFMAPDATFEIDGRVTKYVTYNAVTHSGKLRIIIKHPAGLQLNMQAVLHVYRL